ncbi:DNA polymerase I [Arcanobacterium hippocoleae]
MSEKTLLLIDGHSMAFRSFYALQAESFRTESGIYTNAVHGFIKTLLRLMKDHNPTHVAVAFDLPGGTFRTRMYSEYKGGRKATPEEFKGQIDLIQRLLEAIGIKWLTYEDYEADDIVATLANRGKENGLSVVIASGDKDSYQLVDDAVSVAYPMPRSQMILLDPAGVKQRSGVSPEIYGDYAALVGEGADNIPGVPGVGPKTAAKWLNEYGSLEKIIAAADTIKGKVGQSLRENIEQVKLNRKLNQLVRDLPIGADFSDFVPNGINFRKFSEICDLLDFNSVRKSVLAVFPIQEGTESETADSLNIALQNTDNSKIELREMQILASNTDLAKFLGTAAEPDNSATRWGIAVEGSKRPGMGKVYRIAIANNQGEVISFDPGQLSSHQHELLESWMNNPHAEKVGHGIKEIMHALNGSELYCETFACCTELQAYLLNPEDRSYDFETLIERFLGLNIPHNESSDTLGINLDGTLTQDQTLEFSAVQVLNLADVLAVKLSEAGQSDDLISLEVAVAVALFKMENRGIAVDLKRLDALHKEFGEEVELAQCLAYNAIGDDTVNLSSPKQLQTVLFEQLGLPKTKKTKSGYTTNAQALADLLEKISMREDSQSVRGQEFLAALLKHRDAIKLLQSVEGLQKAVQPDGRIRTTYQQTVAATGRLSSTEPNLQNIHARTEEGLQIREVFVPGAGYDLLMTADYSQIEMRLMAYLSGDSEIIQAFNAGADLHNYVASRVFGIAEDSVTPAQRSKIKAMSYGLVYGLSAYGLSAQLHISVSEAQKLMDGYFCALGE